MSNPKNPGSRAQDLSLGGLDCHPDEIYLRATFRLQDLPANAPGPLSDFLIALGRATPAALMRALAPALNFSFVARPMQACVAPGASMSALLLCWGKPRQGLLKGARRQRCRCMSNDPCAGFILNSAFWKVHYALILPFLDGWAAPTAGQEDPVQGTLDGAGRVLS